MLGEAINKSFGNIFEGKKYWTIFLANLITGAILTILSLIIVFLVGVNVYSGLFFGANNINITNIIAQTGFAAALLLVFIFYVQHYLAVFTSSVIDGKTAIGNSFLTAIYAIINNLIFLILVGIIVGIFALISPILGTIIAILLGILFVPYTLLAISYKSSHSFTEGFKAIFIVFNKPKIILYNLTLIGISIIISILLGLLNMILFLNIIIDLFLIPAIFIFSYSFVKYTL